MKNVFMRRALLIHECRSYNIYSVLKRCANSCFSSARCSNVNRKLFARATSRLSFKSLARCTVRRVSHDSAASYDCLKKNRYVCTPALFICLFSRVNVYSRLLQIQFFELGVVVFTRQTEQRMLCERKRRPFTPSAANCILKFNTGP